MELSQQQNILLNKYLKHLNNLYEIAAKYEWWAEKRFLPLILIAVILFILAYHASSTSLAILFVILAVAQSACAIWVHDTGHKSYLTCSKKIRKIETHIFSKYKLIYCKCTKGTHFFSPYEKKIWNTKSNIFFDHHGTKRGNSLIFNYIEDPYRKISDELSFTR